MIIFVILIVIILIIMLYFKRNNAYIKNKFIDNNTIIFGVKGSGKDLLTQLVIYLRYKQKKDTIYYANNDYGYNYNHCTLKDLSVYPNTYENLIENKIHTINKTEKRESIDCYISDAGIYLPSQYDTLLSKLYPSFPIYYAISRHLYNSNIHMNVQNLERIWKKIREQADHYILARGCINIKFLPWIFVKTRYYSRYQSALEQVSPMSKVGLLNKYNRALIAEYEAKNGIIKNGICCIRKSKIKYDTRHFHKNFFGYAFSDKK